MRSETPIEYTIPAAKENGNDDILVVLFGLLFANASVQNEAIRLIHGQSEAHEPAFVYIKNLGHDVFGNFGNLGDIYEIAATARARGWKAVTFFDEKSWRQHKGDHLDYEDTELSASLVNTECVPKQGLPSPETTFFIKRLPLAKALEESLAAEPQESKIWGADPSTVEKYEFTDHLHAGFYLFNPHQPLFSSTHDDDVLLAQRKTLDESTKLPEELKQKILSEADPTAERPLGDLIELDLGSKREGSRPIIQPLVHLDEDQLAQVVNMVDAAMGKKNTGKKTQCNGTNLFIMGQWKPSAPANRRDVGRVLDFYVDKLPRVIFVLDTPREGLDLDTTIYISPTSDLMEPAKGSFHLGRFRREPLKTLMTWWKCVGQSYSRGFACSPDDKTEIFLNPLGSFPPGEPPHWLHTIPWKEIRSQREEGGGGQEAGMDRQSTFPLTYPEYLVAFSLTGSLTEEETANAKELILNSLEDGDGCQLALVPWAKEEDGGSEDILRIMKQLGLASQCQIIDQELSCMGVFIDRESLETRKPIIAHWRYVLSHGFSGVEYGRLDLGEWQISDALVNLGISNMDFMDFIEEEEISFIQDPDYVGPVEEDDEDELSASSG